MSTVASRYRVDGATFVLTTSGPMLVESLAVPCSVAIVGGDGHARYVEATRVEPEGERECAQLMSTAGELALFDTTRVITRRGPRTTTEIRGDLDAGSRLAVELIRDATLERPARLVSARDYLLGVLDSCDGYLQVPVGTDRFDPGDDISFLLEEAEIEHSVGRDERWCGVLAVGARARRLVVSSHRDALSWAFALTAWTEPGVSRTPLDRYAIRALVMAQATASGRAFVVDYTPAYAPVEALLRLTPDPQLPFAEVKAIKERVGSPLVIEVAATGHLVANLHMISRL